MSIETIAPQINFYDGEPQENTTKQQEQPEETLFERRIRLHKEAAVIPPALHELETRHQTLTLGLIALASQIKIASNEASTHTSSVLREERGELAMSINKLRKEQRRLIDEIARCNNTIERPRPPQEGYDDNSWREPRRQIEEPYTHIIHNGGENPHDISTLSPEHNDEESLANGHRYLQNATL